MMNFNNIIHIEERDNVSLVFLHDGVCVKSDKSIGQLEEETSDVFFFRAHPAHLINLNFISKIHLGPNPSVEMNDGVVISLHTDWQSVLIKYFEKFSQ